MAAWLLPLPPSLEYRLRQYPGCLGFGIAALFARGISPELNLAVIAGFFGAFTTFSTYIFEIEQLLDSGHPLTAGGSFLLQNLVGFATLCVGMKIVG